MKDVLVTKYIVGDASPEEVLVVEQWISSNHENEKVYQQMKKAWELSKQTTVPEDIDVDRVWADFVRRKNEREEAQVKYEKPSKFFSVKWMIAAVTLLCLGISLYFFAVQSAVDKQLQSFADVRRDQLPDGSVVTLNKYSQIAYSESWLSKNRSVKLTSGEVFFEVKRDEKHPFVIDAGKTKITVLGTSFHVRRSNGETEVIVASGSVSVRSADQEVILKPLQSVLISDTLRNKLKVDTVPDQLYRYYVHQEFVFENTPLPRVIEILNKAYDQHLVLINPKHRQLLLTATFEQQPLSEIIKVLLETFDLKIEKKGDEYHIK
ncbi:FecR family protein [Sphingobacterium spiritivorum]|uniref:FecR family protein n=1 Tax=Sphingobacterium spiritivorum TaxID=258 RepID=UPI001917F09A|nr:FecR domain-containing protein [Sphingobacterium spiritivorum]QQT27384.1 FecR domain-containing protein [Sphingobacterium spiritivorum]